MALIIEHGGGSPTSSAWAGALQGLAGFQQGQEAGRLRRLAEERAEKDAFMKRMALEASIRQSDASIAQGLASNVIAEQSRTDQLTEDAYQQNPDNIGSDAWAAKEGVRLQGEATAANQLAHEERLAKLTQSNLIANGNLEINRNRSNAQTAAANATEALSTFNLQQIKRGVLQNRALQEGDAKALLDNLSDLPQRYPRAMQALAAKDPDWHRKWSEILKGSAAVADPEERATKTAEILNWYKNIEDDLKEDEEVLVFAKNKELATKHLARWTARKEGDPDGEGMAGGLLPSDEKQQQWEDALEAARSSEDVLAIRREIADWHEEEAEKRTFDAHYENSMEHIRNKIAEVVNLRAGDDGHLGTDHKEKVKNATKYMEMARAYNDLSSQTEFDKYIQRAMDAINVSGLSGDTSERAAWDAGRSSGQSEARLQGQTAIEELEAEIARLQAALTGPR